MLPIVGQGWKEKDKDYFSEDKEVKGVNLCHNAASLEQPFREGIIGYTKLRRLVPPFFFPTIKKKKKISPYKYLPVLDTAGY